MDAQQNSANKGRELRAFLFLTVILAPAAAVALVGGLGFTIWIYQMIVGPPGPL
ncbi:MAG: periplasmic nitrate reductase, NapE protein [Methyloligellaceae bacterium]